MMNFKTKIHFFLDHENFWGISCEKSQFYAKKNHIFTNFRGGAGRVHPPPTPLPESAPD
jgi:hypothetical protein